MKKYRILCDADNTAENLAVHRKVESNNEYIFDYTKDDDPDLINLVNYVLYKDSINNNMYYFGYEFTESSSSKQRTNFINYIKGYTDKKIKPGELRRFIDRPLHKLNQKINFNNIDAIIYPESQKNNLNHTIIQSVINFIPRGKKYGTYTVVKNSPSDIIFDYDAFAAVKGGNDSRAYKDSLPKIEKMMQEIRQLEYFHIAKDVPTQYRPYITCYLTPKTDFSDKLSSASNILVVDDVNTSSSAVREVLRIITNINPKANIYVFTLIEKNQ